MIEITVNERIKLLRTQILKNEKGKSYSQLLFGNLLGVGRDVIGNLEYGRVEAKDHMIKLICSTFNINEEWLRNGEEPIFNEENEEKNIIDTLKKQGVKPMVLEIIENYLEMSDTSKEIFDEYLKTSKCGWFLLGSSW